MASSISRQAFIVLALHYCPASCRLRPFLFCICRFYCKRLQTLRDVHDWYFRQCEISIDLVNSCGECSTGRSGIYPVKFEDKPQFFEMASSTSLKVTCAEHHYLGTGKSWVDEAISKKLWLILELHR